MVETLEDLKIGILFAIGGDGTLRGAQAISDEAARRGLAISVIGIPKTIDNDISFVQKTFGFETAVTEARRATYAANAEAEAARNGIGLVKLMGRDSGFIAAYSVLVDGQVNFCLVPEVPFSLERFLSALKQRIERRGHAVIVVAEGAGQDLMAPTLGRARCVGKRQVRRHRRLPAGRDQASTSSGSACEINLKYIDPSYTIRSVPATAARLGLLPAPRALRRARGHERADEHGRQLLELTIHPCADLTGRVRAQEDRPRRTALERRPRVDGAAAGHARPRPGGGGSVGRSTSVAVAPGFCWLSASGGGNPCPKCWSSGQQAPWAGM